MKKLHIGVGGNSVKRNPCIREGWIETDISPREPHVVRMDATKRFHYDNATFDYVFSEHMIEHVSYDDGLNVLAECHRVLKPGGKVRISCPDMQFLVDLYNPQLTPLQQAYIDKCHADNPTEVRRPTRCHLVNWFVRMGAPAPGAHTFIWDVPELEHALVSVSFTDIQRFNVLESNDEHLRGLEATGRLPPGMLQLETFTLEGTKV